MTQCKCGVPGLSPRGRGKHGTQYARMMYRRSIPAWAGETVHAAEVRNSHRVYPRVGGGKLVIGSVNRRSIGSIPAWAGETLSEANLPVHYEVYPRVGGGNGQMLSQATSIAGLSPRGRGKLVRAVPVAREVGSIPAWAGETHLSALPRRRLWVYPRVGGGN